MSTKPSYLDAFPAINPGRPLVIPVTPKAGEGLPELLLRAASENSYTATSTVLLASGLSGRYPAGIATNAIGHEVALANTLGVEGGADAISRLVYKPIEGRPGWHEFFGQPLRIAHREVLRRRVSPRALCHSNHARAIWSVKVFSFDPETKEVLLDRCPECMNWLGYGPSYGVQSCGFCLSEDAEGFIRGRIDLRDFPQPVVEVEDTEGLDFVTGLLDPNPDVRSNFKPVLAEELRGYSNGALFEFVVALSCAITADPSKATAFLPRPAAREEYVRFTPEVLALAGRTVLTWPRSFDRLCSLVRGGAESRSGHYGIKKELGPLLALRLDPHIEPGLREAARAAIEADMQRTSTGHTMVRRKENLFREDLTTIEQASKRYRISRRSLRAYVAENLLKAYRAGTAAKAPILISSKEVEAVQASRNELVPVASASKQLGIPFIVLESLTKVGLLKETSDPVGHPSGTYYYKDSIEGLKTLFQNSAHPAESIEELVRVERAAFRLGSPFSNPWPEIIAGVIKGQLEIRSFGNCKNFLGNYYVTEASLQAFQTLSKPWPEDADQTPLTRDAVGFLLDIPTPSVYALIQDKLLTAEPNLEEVQTFAANFMLSCEAASWIEEREVQRVCEVANIMLRSGLKPIHTTAYKARRVWLREDVMSIAKAPAKLPDRNEH